MDQAGSGLGKLPIVGPVAQVATAPIRGLLGGLFGENQKADSKMSRLNPRSMDTGQKQGMLPSTQYASQQIPSFTGQKLNPLDFSSSNNYLDTAKKFLGTNEFTHNKTLSQFFEKSLGKSINPQKTAWCAAFANSILKNSGRPGTNSLMARSFLKYGSPTQQPTEGDIAVFSRGKSPVHGHVGFYMGTVNKGGKDYIKVLGGNQGNSVSIKTYPVDRLLGFRRPPDINQL